MKQNYKSVVWVCCATASLVPLMGSGLNLALPHINFGGTSLTTLQSGLVVTGYMLMAALFQFPAAKIADRIGRRTIFQAGIVVFCVAATLCALSWNGWSLIGFRALMGIGSAMVFATNVAILTSAVPADRRGWALGINTATVYFALAAGPFLGGIMTRLLDWHGVFLLSIAIGVVVLAGSFVVLKENWRPTEKSFNNVGLLLRNRLFKHGILSALINYAATNSVVFMLTFYLQDILSLSIMEASGVIVTESVIMAVVSLYSGRLSDRIEPRRLTMFGMALSALGLGMFCFIGAQTSFIYVMVVLAILGFGFGIFSSPNMNIIMGAVEREQYSMASATTGVVRIAGQAISMGIAMLIMNLTVGNVPHEDMSHAALLTAIRVTFVISAILCAAGVYSSGVRNRKLAIRN